MNIIDNNICAPQGFLATSICAGIRKNREKPDLALIYSECPAVAAGVFTLNQVKAAPVTLTQTHLAQQQQLQAIVVNSGNANACTGKLGELHAKQMANTTAASLQIDPALVGVASTGVIGVTLPIEKIVNGITTAATQLTTDGNAAACAIMTTDTFPKSIAIEINLHGKPVRIGGIAKGSGMIHPNMATMLGFITTDAVIVPQALQQALTQANNLSFNMITVDGDCSTNDMVLLLANGMANHPTINSIDDPAWPIFYEGLLFVCTYLAKQIAQDGEGATKLIEVQVTGAKSLADAQVAARAVCSSSLVKTAIFGGDANWGRIASALGASGATIDQEKLSITLADLPLLEQGMPLPFDETIAAQSLSQPMILIKVQLNQGPAAATAWGCDLSYDYIKINASYRS
ncbi:MAG TPA: bifunctional glutamate N-acetyltransferase/amino-acid acetyltransferase ArgJ [Gammaproteobacteria bacterium]|jgi:glutamate N-acetyltransferase/amino-acid N-acetyltransferase|nr:bifunctional glutamate N-acetyltransferase/amino-acid acetyltransferase ArgJ [Gammaproteobacteria bacterium]